MLLTATRMLGTAEDVVEEEEDIPPSLRKGVRKRGKRRSFRTVFVTVSVVHRLKALLARRRASSCFCHQCKPKTKTETTMMKAKTSSSRSSSPQVIWRSNSEPARALRPAGSGKHTPNWIRSLSNTQELERKSRQACGEAERSLPASASAASAPQAPLSSSSSRGNENVMCKRHALRNLWKRYFAAINIRVSNFTKNPKARDLDSLGSILRDDMSLHEPGGVAQGKRAVIEATSKFSDPSISFELVHNFVDEGNSVTISEHVVEYGSKHFRLCGAVWWDIEEYGSGDGDGLYREDLVLTSSSLPAVKRIELFGKGMSLLPSGRDDDEEEEGDDDVLGAAASVRRTRGFGAAGEAGLGAVVARYIEALLADDYEAIRGMLCRNFRISALDGVKTRDSFVAWLEATTFRRKVQDVFVDHKAKTAYLKLLVQFDSSSARAVVVNLVQWDLRVDSIINIREYGTGFK
ncbi:hypothetical protein HOP50_16g77710 [Chloropicon primus]|nr:hypothetical protein HOP50_16g77710 [Chloropicon primus]